MNLYDRILCRRNHGQHTGLGLFGAVLSLANTNFIVLLAFLGFVGVLIYFKVPAMVAGMLDKRADGIRQDLYEARRLRDEAKEIYASYGRRSRDVFIQADQIVANAKREAESQAQKAKDGLSQSIQRRMQAAFEQVENAEKDAVRAVRDTALQAAIAAAGDVLKHQVQSGTRASGVDEAISDVARFLN